MDAAQIAAMIADRKAGTPGLLDTLGRRNRKIVDRPCQVCGAVFRPDRASRKCCSRKCGTANNGGHNRMPERWVTHISGYIVGTVFINGVQTRVRQHRWIMQQHLGRELSDDEDVHHINGIKNDNRIENLEVISHSDHSRLHNECRIYRRGYKVQITPSDRERRIAQCADMRKRKAAKS